MSKYSVEALDCRFRGPRFQAIAFFFFILGVCSTLSPQKVVGALLTVFSRGVYTVSFGRDVKLSFLGYWLVNSIQLLFPLVVPH